MADQDFTQSVQLLPTNIPPLGTIDPLSGNSYQSIAFASNGLDALNLPTIQDKFLSSSAVLPVFTAAPPNQSVELDSWDILTNQQGVFTVGKGGKLAIDVLADNGKKQGQLGVFSLTGMDELELGSAAFSREAVRRVLQNDGQGYLMFDDATQGARFNGELGEKNRNSGSYDGVKTVGFEAGEKVALILMPEGSFQRFSRHCQGRSEQPLFSIAAANPRDKMQLATFTDHTFAWEDQTRGGKERDFNDLVIKVTGATTNLTPLDQVLNDRRDWQDVTFAQQLRDFAHRPNVILEWNKVALEAIKTDKSAPPVASRNLAILETAVFDAVNGLSNFYESYQVTKNAPAGASIEAAAAAAAYHTLLELYPAQKATLDSALANFLQTLPAGKSVTDGLAYGKDVAVAALANRAQDGSQTPIPYTVGTEVGQWQPTGPVTSPLLPQWSKVQPFALEKCDQFRPTGTSSLTSSTYAQQFDQVKELGAINSTTRTADQTETAKFWADGAGTYTPPGHWNDIANQILSNSGSTLIDNAHTMALLNIALADAGIACWDAKYTYNTWRPVTAIHQADQDNNPDTITDATWQPLLTTPPFPEYVSGHSTFSSAAATVLSSLLGDNVSFSTTTIGLPGVTRSFTSFQQAANEAGMSRIYGGIHFMDGNLDGLALGKQVGNYALSTVLQAK